MKSKIIKKKDRSKKKSDRQHKKRKVPYLLTRS